MIADQATKTAGPPAPGIEGRLPGQPGRANPNNLPLPLTTLVGRTEALAAIQRLLATARLVTLTGPGGVGKTRLAQEAAFTLLGSFKDGVWWVDLAPLCDGGLVDHTIALALGLPEDASRTRTDILSDCLRDRDLLLVLDNCEHVIAECAALAGQLLHAGAGLHILATSREPLAIGGETIWPVPPLSVPCLEGPPTLQAVGESESGQLFLQRARAIQPEFAMTEASAGAVARVCCLLDGLPLAIELAAAWVPVLSVPEIADRLDDRFGLLTRGSRTALPRQQTLQAAIDWSYDLLSGPEQRLFGRLAVFAGGFGLEAAQAVASDAAGIAAIPAADVLDLLSRLVAKSLIVVLESAQTRYRMLDTFREYAWQRLLASGEEARIRRCHLAYYLDLAERAAEGLSSEDQVEWLKRLEIEHDNLRAALFWSQESEARDAGLRLATALAGFWLRVGYLSEGLGWLERSLAACRQVDPARTGALYQAGRLALQRGEYEQAHAFARQSLALSRHLGERQGMARALGLVGWISHWQGDRDAALPLLEEALALAREGGDERTIARTLLFLGDLRLRLGAPGEAAPLLEESLALYQRMGDGWSLAWASCALGEVARLEGEPRRAEALLRLSLAFYQDLDSKPEIPYPLEALALVATDQGDLNRAARLWGAASAVRQAVHSRRPPSYEVDHAPYLAVAREALGEEAFDAAWNGGRALTLEEILAEAALAREPVAPAAPPAVSHPPAQLQARGAEYGLTPREVEVLRLVATGLTDAQVAGQLFISPRTVGKHLQSIYGKLHLPSRSAATRWAIEHYLA